MDFAIREEQRILQDGVARALEGLSPLDRVRQAAERNEPVARDVWEGLVALGVPAMLIPEAHGGLGLEVLDAALVAEMLGRYVAPVPFVASCVMAPVSLRSAGSPAQQAAWLPRLASGEIIAGVAIAEAAAGARDGAGVTATNGRLTGIALFVMDGVDAGLFIVADRAGALHLVDPYARGVQLIPLTTVDVTRPVCELRFESVRAEPLGGDASVATMQRMRDAGRVMLAADTLGAGWRMIEMATAYAKQRKQFGRAIGSFQAVKHMCAEMAAELEPGRALMWYAAHAQDHLPEEASLMAAHAKAYLTEVGRFVARTAVEVHGGIGITDLLGLHYWFKRIGVNRQLLGGPERLREEAARLQGLAA